MSRAHILTVATALALCACPPGAAAATTTRAPARAMTRATARAMTQAEPAMTRATPPAATPATGARVRVSKARMGTGARVTATMSAAFTPERLGAATTVSLGFQIDAGKGQTPSPLTGLDFHFPANLGIATSGLGVATCAAATLQAHGPSACPPDSRMGAGSALVEIPLGGDVETETASLALVAGPSQEGYVRLLVSATGLSPVIARIVIPSLLLTGHFKLAVPLVESLPEGPYVSVVRVQLTLGGNLTYYEPVRGRMVAYRPAGIGLPRSCPHGGFPFSTDFIFQDGEHATARTAVACPRGRD